MAWLWNHLADALNLPLFNETTYTSALQFMKTADYSKVTTTTITDISDRVGNVFRYIPLVVFPGLIWFLLKKHRLALFCKSYDMNALKKEEVKNWPQITPVVSLDLVKQGLDDGPWAMAKTPLHFGKENNLVHIITQDEQPVYSSNAGLSERLFVLQMGPTWQGVHSLPIYVKALLVIFMSRTRRDRKDADHLLTQISRSAHGGQLDFSGVEATLPKYADHKLLKWAAKRHAYVSTLMATCLEMARSDGVLATSEFLWLKPVDRKLWYMLNSVGRQTAVVEVAGPFAHWVAEKRMQRALRVPMVGEAVKAFEACMNEILFVEERGG